MSSSPQQIRHVPICIGYDEFFPENTQPTTTCGVSLTSPEDIEKFTWYHRIPENIMAGVTGHYYWEDATLIFYFCNPETTRQDLIRFDEAREDDDGAWLREHHPEYDPWRNGEANHRYLLEIDVSEHRYIVVCSDDYDKVYVKYYREDEDMTQLKHHADLWNFNDDECRGVRTRHFPSFYCVVIDALDGSIIYDNVANGSRPAPTCHDEYPDRDDEDNYYKFEESEGWFNPTVWSPPVLKW